MLKHCQVLRGVTKPTTYCLRGRPICSLVRVGPKGAVSGWIATPALSLASPSLDRKARLDPNGGTSAVAVGFGPTGAASRLTPTVFETAALDHSATPPARTAKAPTYCRSALCFLGRNKQRLPVLIDVPELLALNHIADRLIENLLRPLRRCVHEIEGAGDDLTA